jgi:hypothetical protein
MVRELLPRRLDEMSYKFAMAIEEAGTPIEAAFWRKEEEDRWFLFLASAALDETGGVALEKMVRERFASTVYGNGMFDLNDVRFIGMEHEALLRVRLRHSAPRGAGIAFTGDHLILWARRTQPDPSFTVLLETENAEDAGCELMITPLSTTAIRFKVVPPAGHSMRKLLPPGRDLAWKADLEFPELGRWLAAGEGLCGQGNLALTFDEDHLVVDWRRGKGHTSRRPIVEALGACEREYRRVLKKLDGFSTP